MSERASANALSAEHDRVSKLMLRVNSTNSVTVHVKLSQMSCIKTKKHCIHAESIV